MKAGRTRDMYGDQRSVDGYGLGDAVLAREAGATLDAILKLAQCFAGR